MSRRRSVAIEFGTKPRPSPPFVIAEAKLLFALELSGQLPLNLPKGSEASKRIKLGRLGKAFQLVRSERHDERRIEQPRKSLRHQKRLAGDTADPFQSAHQIDIRTDQREIESVAVADITVAYVAVMERNASAKLGIRYRELLETLERA